MHILIISAYPVAAQGFFDDPVVTIGLGVLAVIVWGLVFLVRRDSKQVGTHMQALAAYATAHGYDYEPGLVEGFGAQFPELPLGPTQSVSSVLSRTHGARPFWAFNYSPFVGSAGSSSGSTRVSLAMFVMQSNSALGILALRPKGFFGRLRGALGKGDVETGSAEFDRVYHISTPHPEWVQLLLSTDAVQGLLRFRPRRLVLRDSHVRIIKMGLMNVETLEEDKQIAEILLDAAAAPQAAAAAQAKQ